MITLLEALHFRCLENVQRPLGPFQVLVGPNASGKTTFLDVVAFLGRLVSEGLDAAVNRRTQNFQDLVYGRSGKHFELAIEAEIPKDRREKLADKEFKLIRYEVSVGLDVQTDEMSIFAEKVLLKKPELVHQEGKPNGSSFLPPRNRARLFLAPKRLGGQKPLSTKSPQEMITSMTRRAKGGIIRSDWGPGSLRWETCRKTTPSSPLPLGSRGYSWKVFNSSFSTAF